MSKPVWFEAGPPTVDRPFGIHLWPIFEKLYDLICGGRPQDFRFTHGETPMSTLRETAAVLSSYYVIILGGRETMRHFSPLKLNGLFKLHNLFLTIVSFCLMVLFVEQLFPMVWRNGIFFAICHKDGGWTDKLVVLYYLNYITKYIELIDTCFLFLKKKPLTFLHTYHHGATALLCYTQLIGHTPVSWVPITINLAVHVVMYWYYFQSARGVRVWWKQYITIFQIVQFIVDVGFIYFASYTYFTSAYFPYIPNAGKCAGEEFAAFAGMGIISSYLLLFISFYFATYKKPIKKGRGRARSALVEMKDESIPTVGEARNKLSHGSSTAINGNGNVGSSEKASSGRVPRTRKA